MGNLFFYGTLCHVPLLEAVLDAAPGSLGHRISEAHLDGFGVYWVKDQPYPTIRSNGSSSAVGIVLKDVAEDEEARLSYYEGGFSYDLKSVEARLDGGTITASCYFPVSDSQTLGASWSLADWASRWGEMAVGAAKDVMLRFETDTAEAVAPLRPFFMARHWARKLAQKADVPARRRRGAQADDVTISTRHRGYRGFFELAVFDFDYTRFDGSRAPSLTREAFLAFDAALVLPYDPKTDRLLLIEQMRFGPLWREDPNPWIFEPIAGLVDAGEDPMETARREAQEEAGLALGPMELMTRVYASPGYSTEFFHCFLAVADLSSYEAQVGGLLSEHEDIRSHVMSFDEAMGLIATGEVNAGPLVMMLYWLAAHRDRLRAAA